jgi:hypothetical protein
MRTHLAEDLGPYVARLKELPFVEEARLAELEPRRRRIGWDALLEIRAGGRTHRFLVEHKRTPRLDYALVDALLGRLAAQTDARWVLFTPHVTPPMAAHLQRQGVNYMDLAGNCRLIIDKGHVAIIEGRRPARGVEEARVVGPAGYQVLFALLVRPELLQTPIRDVAREAGVGKTVVATTLQRLEQAGLVARTQTKAVLVKPKELLDRWLTGYHDILRPRNLVGHYRTPDRTPVELENRVEEALGLRTQVPLLDRDKTEELETRRLHWAWGGAAAAYRLTGHFRGEATVLHIDPPPIDLTRHLRLLPARAGNLTILRAPGPMAYEGAAPRTVHPLLVYAELLATRDDRAREAAVEVRERFLRHLG